MKSALYLRKLLFFVVATALSSSEISFAGQPELPGHKIKSIAIASKGGPLAEAIGVELSKRNFMIIDTKEMEKLLIRLNVKENEITKPKNLLLLKNQGIDAYLTVRYAVDYDDNPQSARVKLISTFDGKKIAGFAWRNISDQQTVSNNDEIKKKDTNKAAQEIVILLYKKMRE